jgi:hypothetical protein
MRTRQQAEEGAKQLLELLDGEGWETVIWENLGWCYKAVNGYISVSITIADKYFASLAIEKGSPGTPTYWSDHGVFDHPMDAVMSQMKKAVEFVNFHQAVVNDALKTISCTPHDVQNWKEENDD